MADRFPVRDQHAFCSAFSLQISQNFFQGFRRPRDIRAADIINKFHAVNELFAVPGHGGQHILLVHNITNQRRIRGKNNANVVRRDQRDPYKCLPGPHGRVDMPGLGRHEALDLSELNPPALRLPHGARKR